jgi:transposase, IS5 family
MTPKTSSRMSARPGSPRTSPRTPAIEDRRSTGAPPVTADRGYGQTSVDDALAELGVELVAILHKGQPGKARQQIEAADSFVELVKWRTGAEGRIAALKRQHGWGRARLRSLEGARTWCGWGILSHNAIKIAALAN